MNPQLDIGVNLSGSDQFAADAKVTQDALVKMDGQAKRIIQTQKNLSKQSGQLRGVFGQLGYQVQDVAVQLQGGQNAMMVFGQQGSQVLSIFGAWGAIAGAVVAVGSALYTASSSMKSAADAADVLNDKVQDLAVGLKDATSAMYQFHIADASNELREMEKTIEANTKRFHELSNATGEIITEFGENDYHVRKNREEMEELERANAQLADSYATLVNALYPKTEAEKKAEAAIKASKQATVDKIDSLWDEYATYGMSAEQLVAYTLKKQGATDAQIEEAVALQRSISELEAEAKAREEAAKKIEAQRKEMEKLRDQQVAGSFNEDSAAMDRFEALQESFRSEAELARQATQDKVDIINEIERKGLASATEIAQARVDLAEQTAATQQQSLELANSSMLNSVGQFTANMAASLDETSGIGKAFFAVSKGIAVAQAIIEAEKGAAGAMAAAGIRAAAVAPIDPTGALAAAHLATGQVHANIIRGMGYASAGLIAGQALASFEGGGLTGSGVRSGGIDGKGGMIAMLHPNEKVTDLTKGGGESQPVNVNFSISAVDAEGFDKLLATRQGMIVNMINRAVNNSGRRSLV